VSSKLQNLRFLQNSRTLDFFKTPEPYISSKLQNLRYLQNSRTIDFFKTPET